MYYLSCQQNCPYYFISGPFYSTTSAHATPARTQPISTPAAHPLQLALAAYIPQLHTHYSACSLFFSRPTSILQPTEWFA